MTVTELTQQYADSFLSEIAIPVRAVDAPALEAARRDYNAWSDTRTSLSAAERDGDIPDAGEWHNSDDAAVKLLDRIAAALGWNTTPQG